MSCRYAESDGTRCQKGAAPECLGGWAAKGYCYEHASLLGSGACTCALGRFYHQAPPGLTPRSAPCSYCRARALEGK